MNGYAHGNSNGVLAAHEFEPAFSGNASGEAGLAINTRYRDVADGRQSGWYAARAKLKVMASRMLAMQENERKRLATDLHDGLGQSLSMIKFTLAETQSLLADGSVDRAAESLQQLKNKIHGVLDEVRHISMGMRPPMLDDLGLHATLSWFARELQAVSSSRKIELDIGVRESTIPKQLKIVIFRIIQESTNNIVKHANASVVRIALEDAGASFRLVVEDDGDGFDQAEVAVRAGSTRGLGMLSMKERAMLSGGDYRIVSVPGQGTRIEVTWRFDQSLEG